MICLRPALTLLVILAAAQNSHAGGQCGGWPECRSLSTRQLKNFAWPGTKEMLPYQMGTKQIEINVATVRSLNPPRLTYFYLPGFADSIANQVPLARALTAPGNDFIALDWPGQGESSGSMNDSRVTTALYDSERLSNIVRSVFARTPIRTRDVIFVGWSTGGLVAYQLATEGFAKNIALISPAFEPRPLVGEGGKVTIATLSSEIYRTRYDDPHIDPPHPQKPLFETPLFGLLLIKDGYAMQRKALPSDVNGIAFFGDENSDAYVGVDLPVHVLQRRAPQLTIFQFPGARHELQNEVPALRNTLTEKILKFGDAVRAPRPQGSFEASLCENALMGGHYRESPTRWRGVEIFR